MGSEQPGTLARGRIDSVAGMLQLPSTDKRVPDPGFLALVGALVYLVLSALWIILSGEFIAQLADSEVELHYFELQKGIGFVLVTSALFYIVLRYIFGQLARREETIRAQHEALLHAERSAVASTLSSSVAHDLRNALATAELAMEELREVEGVDPETLAFLTRAYASMNRLCEDLIRAGRAEISGEDLTFDLADAVRVVIDFAERHPKMTATQAVAEVPDETLVTGSRNLVCRALMNAAVNAAEAGASRLTISTRRQACEGPLEILIDDDGTGIDNPGQQQLFDPLYTTKGDGHGLGLSTLAACAEYHGGTASAATSPLGGARFILAIGAERLHPN